LNGNCDHIVGCDPQTIFNVKFSFKQIFKDVCV
jgi:hypothetical protein